MSAVKNISLRRFRDDIVTIREVVEVSRRDPEGNIQLLGFWTPYSVPEGAKPLSRPDGDEDPPHVFVRPGDQLDLMVTRGPHVIRTPEEARETASAIRQIRPVPKEIQTGRKRR